MTAEAQTLPHEFFVDTWTVYKKIVQGNFMFHQEIYQSVDRLLKERDPVPFSLLDLGCGDAENFHPLLLRRNVAHYVGVDLSVVALKLAAEHLQNLHLKVEFQVDDMLHFLEQEDPRTFDVIFSGFALHHLSPNDKRRFLIAVKKRLKPKGEFILVDVFRGVGQHLPDYLDAYCEKMANEWKTLTKEEMDYAITHVREFDTPDTLKTIEILASEAGFTRFENVNQFTWHRLIQMA
jgi:SAM-dependent methyltransferase